MRLSAAACVGDRVARSSGRAAELLMSAKGGAEVAATVTAKVKAMVEWKMMCASCCEG
jgi:hypothetical protein